jgi:hypothetical protein
MRFYVCMLQAGAVVQQQLSQVRTVTAYNGQEAAVKEYNAKLDKPLQVGSVGLAHRV